MSEPIGRPGAVVPGAGPDAAVGTADTADTTDTEVRPRPGTGRPGRPSLGWTEIAVAIVAFLVFSVASIVVTGLPGPQGQNTIPVLAGAAVAFLLAVAVALALRVRSLPAVGLRSTTWRWLLAGVGVGVLARILAFGLVLGYMAITGDQSNPQDYMVATATSGAVGLLLVLVFGAVLTPVAEELMFRGVLYGALRRYGIVAATIVSALLFGLAHGFTIVFPVAVMLGALNALLYERAGSIWPSVVAHAVHNALGFSIAALVLS